MPARVLIVEDDHPTRRSLARSLAAGGFDVDEAADGGEAARRWEARRPDVILLDLGLPDMDGVSLIRRIRRESTTPIIVVSARGSENDRVEALDRGADDYLTKPFGVRELHARIEAVLRRAGGSHADAAGRVVIGSLSVDVARHDVRVGRREVPLTPREFEVLKVLVSNAGRVVTTGRILRAVWGQAYDQEHHYLHVYVSQIRRKIAAADPRGELAELLVTEPGIGYRVNVPPES
jgi:two-component system, OmpR family, KDP operon response regulator KdpE